MVYSSKIVVYATMAKDMDRVNDLFGGRFVNLMMKIQNLVILL